MAPIVMALLNAAPFLADLIFGDKTGKIVGKVSEIAGQVLGVDAKDEKGLSAALAKADPAKYAELQGRLMEFAHQEKMAQIAADRAERDNNHAEVLKRIEDVGNARSQTIELAKLGSPLAWGAAVVSMLVVMSFGFTVYLVFQEAIPEGNRDMAFYIVGQISTFAGLVVAYWVGSSRDSASKTELIAKAPPVGGKAPP